MTRRYRKKMICVIMVGTLLMSIDGCGKRKQAEDVSQDIKNLEEASETDAQGTGDSATFEEPFDFEVKSPDGKTFSFTNLTMKDCTDGKGRVYEVEASSMDDDEVREFAAKLFDDGEYEILTPYSVATEEELEKELSYYESTFMEGYDENAPVANYYHLWSEINYFLEQDSSTREIYERDEDEILVPVSVIRAMDIPEEGARAGLLRGNVDGEPWMMEVYVHYMDGSPVVPRVEIYAYNLEVIANLYCHATMDEVNNAVFGENPSDSELCRQEAESFLGRLGYGNSQFLVMGGDAYMDTFMTGGDDETGETEMWQDGYTFVYGMWQEDNPEFSMLNGAYSPDIDDPEDSPMGSQMPVLVGTPYIYVDTRDSKVQEICFTNYMGERSVLSEKSELLPRDTVLNKLPDYLAILYEGTHSSEVQLDNCRLELQYMLLPYQDDQNKTHLNLMPVWILVTDMDDRYTLSTESRILGIQAIDGSMVNFGNVFSTLSSKYY